MAKILGYILSGLGLLTIVFSNKITSLKFLAGLGTKATVYTILAAVALVVAGVVLMLDKGSSKQPEEVPIYEGEGKKSVIVGYQKVKKR